MAIAFAEGDWFVSRHYSWSISNLCSSFTSNHGMFAALFVFASGQCWVTKSLESEVPSWCQGCDDARPLSELSSGSMSAGMRDSFCFAEGDDESLPLDLYYDFSWSAYLDIYTASAGTVVKIETDRAALGSCEPHDVSDGVSDSCSSRFPRLTFQSDMKVAVINQNDHRLFVQKSHQIVFSYCDICPCQLQAVRIRDASRNHICI